MKYKKRILAVLAAGIIACTVTAVALAAVSSQKVINDTSNVHFRVVRTVAEGFDSGWHVHPGVAIVQVQQGSFQITQGSCTPTTVSAGQTYIEVPHLAVRAVTTGHVEWTTTLITDGRNSPQVAWTQYSPGAKDPCS